MNSVVANGGSARARRDRGRPVTTQTGRFADLAPRIASALVLAPLGVAAAVAGEPWIASATGAAVVAMSFEWARMSEPGRYAPAFVATLAGSLGAVMFASRGEIGMALGWLTLCAFVSMLRRRDWTARAETFLGALYVGAPCALFLWLRDRTPEGLDTILFLFAAIWAADVFAYLGGTLIGGPKLHPGLSPQKTWSGIVAGTLAGGAAAAVFALVIEAPHGALFFLVGAATALVGLCGDLFESFAKRRFGVKDASGLIPGHGGVLDRIDGLMMATLVWALALALAPGSTVALFGGTR
jgi:phosphatidate cytidylyltransferase